MAVGRCLLISERQENDWEALSDDGDVSTAPYLRVSSMKFRRLGATSLKRTLD